MNLIFKEIAFGSRAYKHTLKLRDEVLRKPLGLKFNPGQLEAEKNDHHLCVFADEVPLACLILSPSSPDSMKMRQVAVDPQYQKNGIGRLLVAFAEGFAVEKNIHEIVLHARDDSVPFYEKLGYSPYENPFVEIGIPHQKMKKRLYT